MTSINTNTSSIITRNSLANATEQLNKSIERLTTGAKINHSSDNSANYAIEKDLSVKISALDVVGDNTEQGIDMLDTAEESLITIFDLLSRIRALTVKALDDTNSDETRSILQAEAAVLLEEVNRIRKSTEYNGLHVLGETVEENTYAAQTSVTPSAQSSIVSPFSLENSSEDTLTSAPTLRMTATPMLVSAPTPLMTGASTTISGALDLAANESNKKETIDGVVYTFSNRNSTPRSISYTKDLTTGEITFYCSYVKIEGADTATHKLFINGDYNYVYGGSNNDEIKVTGKYNYIYGNAGDDTIETVGNSTSKVQYNRFYGGEGDDTLTGWYTTYLYGEAGTDTINATYANPEVLGGDGNDTITIGSSWQSSSYNFDGGNGEDTFKIYTTSGINVKGGSDNDTFEIYSSLSNNTIINGGAGTNTVSVKSGGKLNSATLINVVGSTAFQETFSANQTKTLTIDGKNYTITNGSTAQDLVYKINSGVITFITSANGRITITGDTSVAHNIVLNSRYITFYGGSLDDKITINNSSNTVYGLDGVDTIISNNSSNTIYGGNGDDKITNTSDSNTIYGDAGADTISGGSYSTIFGGDGNDNLTSSYYSRILGEAGDDTITVSQRGVSVMCGDDDDNVTVTYDGYGISIDGGDGTNTITGLKGKEIVAGFGSEDNATAVPLARYETKEVTIEGKKYNVYNRTAYDNQVLYSYDSMTEQITFSGNYISVTSKEASQVNNVNIQGYNSYYYGSNNGDTITTHMYGGGVYSGTGADTISIESTGSVVSVTDSGGDNTFNLNSSATVNTGNGANTINVNYASEVTINGGTGVDTYYLNKMANITDIGDKNIYYINCNGASLTGGVGDDTFYVFGDNNSTFGAGGDDYYIVDGENNLIDGGTGTNYYVDSSGGTTNTYQNAEPDPTSGKLIFTELNTTKTFTIGGKTYTIKNIGASGTGSASNELSFYYNANTDTVTMTGDNFTITTENVDNKINLRGSNNSVTGGTLNDTIKIESGTDNVIKGGAGNDTITMESENNQIDAGSGNDTIILNATTTKQVKSGSGTNTITLNSDNNTNLLFSSGTNTINGTSAGNTITLGENNNTITLTGADNTITGGSGNNKVTIWGANSNVELEDGNNTIQIEGENTTVKTGDGNSTVKVWGANSEITAGNGDLTLLLSGDNGTLTAGSGVRNLTVSGNNTESIIEDGDTNLVVSGDDNTITMGNGSNTINITGNGTTLNAGTGNKSLSAVGDSNIINLQGQTIATINGDSNELTTADEADEISVKGDYNTIHSNGGEDTITVRGDDNSLYGGDANDTINLKSGNSNYADGEGGNKNYVYDDADNSEVHNAIKLSIKPFEAKIKVGIGTGEINYIKTDIVFNTKGLAIDYSDKDSITSNLNDIDELLNSVSEQLVDIGAVRNRLDSAISSQTILTTNLASTRSTVRDTDIAEESSKYIMAQILQNFSATLFSTVNQNASITLKLIGAL